MANPQQEVSIVAKLLDQGLTSGLGKIRGIFTNLGKDVGFLQNRLGPLTGQVAGLVAGFATLNQVRDDTQKAKEAVQGERRLLSALDDNREALEAMLEIAQELENTTIFDGDAAGAVAAKLRTLGVPIRDLAEATRLTLDASASLGKEAEATAQLIAKAYRKDTEELSKLGIKVNETGNVVDQLKKRFQGAAAALTETDFGKIDQLNNTLDNLAEERGKVFASIQRAFLEGLVPAVAKFNESLVDGGNKANPILSGIAKTLGGLVPTLIKIVAGVAAVKFVVWAAPVVLVAAKLAIIGGLLYAGASVLLEWTGLLDEASTLGSSLLDTLKGVAGAIADGTLKGEDLRLILRSTLEEFKARVGAYITTPLSEAFSAILTIGTETFKILDSSIKVIFVGLASFIVDTIRLALETVVAGVDAIINGLAEKVGVLSDDLGEKLQVNLTSAFKESVVGKTGKEISEALDKEVRGSIADIEKSAGLIANAIPNAIRNSASEVVTVEQELAAKREQLNDELIKRMTANRQEQAEKEIETAKKQAAEQKATLESYSKDAEAFLKTFSLSQSDIANQTSLAMEKAAELIEKASEANDKYNATLEETKTLVQEGKLFRSEGLARDAQAANALNASLSEVNGQFDKLIADNPESTDSLEKVRSQLAGINTEASPEKKADIVDFFRGFESGITDATGAMNDLRESGIAAGQAIRTELSGSIQQVIKDLATVGSTDITLESVASKVTGALGDKLLEGATNSVLDSAISGIGGLFGSEQKIGPDGKPIPGSEGGVVGGIKSALGLGGTSASTSVMNVTATTVNINGGIGGAGGLVPSVSNSVATIGSGQGALAPGLLTTSDLVGPSITTPKSGPPLAASAPSGGGGGILSSIGNLIFGGGQGGGIGLIGSLLGLGGGVLGGAGGLISGGLGGLIGGASSGTGFLSSILGGAGGLLQGSLGGLIGGASGGATAGASGSLSTLLQGLGTSVSGSFTGALASSAAPAATSATTGSASLLTGLLGSTGTGAAATGSGGLLTSLLGLGGGAATGAAASTTVGAAAAPATGGLSLILPLLLGGVLGGLFNEGGQVPGPTHGRDSKAIGVDGGEFVVQAPVAKSALGFLTALNEGLIPPSMLSGIGHRGSSSASHHFNLGGVVSPASGRRSKEGGITKSVVVASEGQYERLARGGRNAKIRETERDRTSINGVLRYKGSK